MKRKLAAITALVFVLAAAAWATERARNQNVLRAQGEEKRGTIAWYVKKAKEKGVRRVVLLPAEENFAIVSGLDDAASQFTVVLARPVGKKSYVATEASLVTWNRFRVLEVLSTPTAAPCATCLADLVAPPDVPVTPGEEILVPTGGGTVVVDGVTVVAKDKHLGEHFLPSQQYLLFLALDPARGVGKLRMGPYGVFPVDDNGDIRPLAQGDAPLKHDLEAQSGNSLAGLKARLRGRR
ncbi:MAG TPA: hypothetical protein VF736_21495 [Pyrinomonadaceae bacterium]|jgi:hypothetical protein